MKKTLLSLLFIPVVAFSQVTAVPYSKMCTTKNQMLDTLIKFGEEPLLTMVSSNFIDESKVDGYPTVLFVNPKTRSWTLVEQVKEDFFCVSALGVNLDPHINNTQKPI